MIDKICDKLMKRIRAKMPEVDDERAEVIRYGLELIIGELPKMFLLFIIASHKESLFVLRIAFQSLIKFSAL